MLQFDVLPCLGTVSHPLSLGAWIMSPDLPVVTDFAVLQTENHLPR